MGEVDGVASSVRQGADDHADKLAIAVKQRNSLLPLACCNAQNQYRDSNSQSR